MLEKIFAFKIPEMLSFSFVFLHLRFYEVFAFEVDYSWFSSSEEMIAYEESRVRDEALEGELLAEAYMDLGESYLLGGQYELALENLSMGYELARNAKKRKETSFPRALFDLAITYANLDRLEESYFAVASMETELQKCYCRGCQDMNRKGISLQANSDEPVMLGPDKISIQECVNMARGTAGRANDLIAFVKRPEVQFLSRNVVADLESRAINCCHAGGCLESMPSAYSQQVVPMESKMEIIFYTTRSGLGLTQERL